MASLQSRLGLLNCCIRTEVASLVYIKLGHEFVRFETQTKMLCLAIAFNCPFEGRRRSRSARARIFMHHCFEMRRAIHTPPPVPPVDTRPAVDCAQLLHVLISVKHLEHFILCHSIVCLPGAESCSHDATACNCASLCKELAAHLFQFLLWKRGLLLALFSR